MKVVIVGAGYAGVTAARRLERQPGIDVTLVNPTDAFVERIRLHEAAAGHPRAPIGLGEVVVDEVVAVDGDRVVLASGRTLGWERLVLAMGSRSVVPPNALPVGAPCDGRVVIVGGGLTGIELAAELAEAGREVTLVAKALGVTGGAEAYARGVLGRLGVRVVLDEVGRVETGRVVLREGGAMACDVCVWAAGFVGAPLPVGLEVRTNEVGQVCVDAYLRAAPGIYVAGDLAEGPMGCKRALPSGARVAENLVREREGRPLRRFTEVGPTRCVSLGRRDGMVMLGGGQVMVRGRMAAWIKERICRFAVREVAAA